MELLNSKSILDCNEIEEIKHNEEVESLIEDIKNIGNYDCAILAKYQDDAHKNKEQEIIPSSLDEIDDVIERFDIKNGIDIYLSEDGYYVLLLIGSGYQLNEEYHMVQVALKIMPYDKERNFIKINDGEVSKWDIQ